MYHRVPSILVLVAVLVFGASPLPTVAQTPGGTADLLPTGGTGPFAPFSEPPVDGKPQVMHESIEADLSNVTVPFVLTAQQQARLGEIGMVASPGREKEFFTVYEQGRYNYEPLFVTSDSLLHVYHLMFDKVLRSAETHKFEPLLRDLNRALAKRAQANWQSLQGSDPEWVDAALYVWAYFTVAGRLLDPQFPVQDDVAKLVEGELTNIEQAVGPAPSPIFPGLPYGEDYSQYKPRGHYTKTELLQHYFQAMMWYGRMTFRLKPDDPGVGRAETRMALLVADALRNVKIGRQTGMEAWGDLYAPTAFFVGRADDLTVSQYLKVMAEVYGQDVSLKDLTDESRLDSFIAKADQLPPPQILGVLIKFDQDVESTTKGMRFMGQRFVPDAYIFRQLVYRNVGTEQHRRGLPMGLDIFAAMGSQRALDQLEAMDATRYAKYIDQMDKVREILTGYSTGQWTETLYNSWLHSLKPLIDVPGAPLAEPGASGYPRFMQGPAWLDKSLTTVLGSWAELKHDTLLYAKQVYAEMGGGGPKGPPPDPVEPKGYVEPNPHFFARLAALTAMTREGLAGRNLLLPADGDNLRRIEDLAHAFKSMAEKELANQALSDEEYERIRFYGGELEHITIAASLDEVEEDAYPVMDEEPQAAVVADVATDPDPDGDGSPNPVVLEAAVGRVDPIYVVAPVDGALQVVKGAMFSYYEFTHPADDRLTDEKWRSMLDAGQAPARQPWISSYFVEQTVDNELALAVRQFNSAYVSAVWWPDPSSADYMARGAAAQKVKSEADALNKAVQYEGRQLVSMDFRSFDLESANSAIVAARETWTGKLYEQGPDGEAGPLLKHRGPYSIDVTYTLKREGSVGEERWFVSNVVWNSQPPDWDMP